MKRYRKEAKAHRRAVDAAIEESEVEVKLWATTIAEETEMQNKRFAKLEKRHEKLLVVVKGVGERFTMLEEKVGGYENRDTGVVDDSQVAVRSTQSKGRDVQNVAVHQNAVFSRRNPVHTRYD